MTRKEIMRIAYAISNVGEPWWRDDDDLLAFVRAIAPRFNAENEALRSALIELVKVCEMHDQAIAAVIGKPSTWKDEYLNKARAALARAGEKT